MRYINNWSASQEKYINYSWPNYNYAHSSNSQYILFLFIPFVMINYVC